MSYNLSAVPKLQFFDNDGNPLVGGKLYTYEAGTTTPLATYTDSTGATPNTNPIILDSRGEANVWLAGQAYKFVLKTSTDTTIWTVDNVSNAINVSQILASSGTASAPPYSFSADTDTGVYLAAVGQMGLSANGVPFLRGTSTNMTFGQSGGANDVDVMHYGDTTQTGNFTLTGDVNVTGAAVFNEAGADKDFRVEGDTEQNLLFVDASTDSVGIGTATPNTYGKFSVVRTGNAISSIAADNTTSTSVQYGIFNSAGVRTSVWAYYGPSYSGGSLFNVGANGIAFAQEANAPLAIGTSGVSQPIIFGTNGTENVRINTSGNLGIGTISPTSRVHAVTSSGGCVGQFSNGTARAEVGVNSSNQAYFGSGTNHVTRIVQNATTQLQISTAGLVQIDNGYGTLATFYGCRAWVNFNGSGGATIRAAGNVSSVTYGGTGIYTVNFSTAMPDANYSPQASVSNRTTAQNAITQFNTPSTTSIGMDNYEAGVRADNSYIYVAVFR